MPIEQMTIEADTELGTWVDTYAVTTTLTGEVRGYLLLRREFHPRT